MTVVDTCEQKVSLPRPGLEEVWEVVERIYSPDDERAWRRLAMFALRELAGWKLDQISLVMGVCPGHVSRCLKVATRELRQQLRETLTPQTVQCLLEARDTYDGE